MLVELCQLSVSWFSRYSKVQHFDIFNIPFLHREHHTSWLMLRDDKSFHERRRKGPHLVFFSCPFLRETNVKLQIVPTVLLHSTLYSGNWWNFYREESILFKKEEKEDAKNTNQVSSSSIYYDYQYSSFALVKQKGILEHHIPAAAPFLAGIILRDGCC